MVNAFTTHLKQALAKAMHFASEFGHAAVTEEHLLYGLAAEKGSLSSELLTNLNFPVDLLKQDLIRKFHTPYLIDDRIPDLNNQVIIILTKAVRTAQQHEHPYIGTEHVLFALLSLAEKPLNDLFSLWQISVVEMQKRLTLVLKSTSKFPDLTQTIRYLPTNQEEPVEASHDLPVLQSLAKEITSREYLETCPPLIDRQEELAQTQQILGRRHKNNPLLIGKPGVGKTAIVEGLARAILAGDVAASLQNKRIFSLELSSLVAGTMYRGEFEQRMKQMIDEIREHSDVILFIDEIHTLVGAGSSGQPLDAANILKPALARGDIRCIGATTWDEYQKHLAADQALTRRFQMVTVEEPSKQQTEKILDGIKASYEAFHRVQLTEEALATALELSDRYLTHTCFPDKAIDLLDEAASRLVMQSRPRREDGRRRKLKEKIVELQREKSRALQQDDYERAITINKQLEASNEKWQAAQKPARRLRLNSEQIRDVVAMRTGIDANRLRLAAEPIAEDLFGALSREVIGQDEALRQLSTAVQRGYSLMKEANKPIGAYLLLGPSGVGKTATAKALAKFLFDDEASLLRLDMSEYAEPFTVSKLIGAPAGYVGYQQSGVLTNAVKQKPLRVILFDEVEKAHPDIYHLLLQILDEGYLTDGSGQRVDFRHSFIVLTSNLGLNEMQHRLGFSSADPAEESKQTLQSAAKAFFRQELLNRLDGIVHFQRLGIPQRQAIIEKQIQALQQRLITHVRLEHTPRLVQHLAATAYKDEQGVRSLERALRQEIEIPLSESLWKFKKGSAVKLDVRQDRIVIQ